jgi:hypothetical protein
MRTELEIVKLNVKDVVTTSACAYEDCPTLEFDENAMEG